MLTYFLTRLASLLLIPLLIVACGGGGEDEGPDPGDDGKPDRTVAMTWGPSSLVLSAAGSTSRVVGTFTVAAPPKGPAIVGLSVNMGVPAVPFGVCLLTWRSGQVPLEVPADGREVRFALPAGSVSTVTVVAQLSSAGPSLCEWTGTVIKYDVYNL